MWEFAAKAIQTVKGGVMMRYVYIFLLSISALSLCTGCYDNVVHSLQPFYTKETLVTLPQLNGKWVLVESAGEDVCDEKINPWIFQDNEIQIFDEYGVSSSLEVHYFKIDDSVFMDTTVSEVDETKRNFFWVFHMLPVHIVSKVKITNNYLRIIPLSFETPGKHKIISLPYTKLEGIDIHVITATSKKLVDFLQKYKNDKELFDDENEFVFKRYKQKSHPTKR